MESVYQSESLSDRWTCCCFPFIEVNDSTMTISRVASAAGGILSFGLELEGYLRHTFPDVVYYVGCGVGIFLGGMFCCSYFCFCPSEPKKSFFPLVKPKEIERLGITSEIHELCEMHIDGSAKECSMKRISQIITELKSSDQLDCLNTIPSYTISNVHQLDVDLPLYTPLQYWAAKGDLVAVQLLSGAGARDYSPSSVQLSGVVKSALYTAALSGKENIVNYLLSRGADPRIAFSKNILFSFIPFLIFEICQKKLVNRETLYCLEKILQSLAKAVPMSFEKIRKIPLHANQNAMQNCLDFVISNQSNTQLEDLLRKYKYSEGDVLTPTELKKEGYTIGTGFTLGEMARFK